jgi:hypothetical protein
MNKATITLNLTRDEARWLSNALRIASAASKESAPALSKWAHGMALGLEPKLTGPPNEYSVQFIGNVTVAAVSKEDAKAAFLRGVSEGHQLGEDILDAIRIDDIEEL